MASFFTRIRSYFGQQYGGRYLSVILRELVQEASGVASLLNGRALPPDLYRVETEYSFRGAHGLRLADLALIDKRSGRPLLLVEIKHEDEKCPRIHDQLRDYVAEVKRHPEARFLLLTESPPSENDLDLIAAAGARGTWRLWADVYRDLRPLAEQSPAVALFRSYLAETTTVFAEQIESDAVTLLLAKTFDLPHNNGLGNRLNTRERLASVGPTLAAIVARVAALGDEMLRPAKDGFFAIQPWVDCRFVQHFEAPKRGLGSDKGWDGLVNCQVAKESSRIGGVLVVWARNRLQLRAHDSPYISVGLLFYLDRRWGNGRALRTALYANVSKGRESLGWSEVRVALNATEGICLARAKTCSKKAVDEALRQKALSARERAILAKYLRHLSGNAIEKKNALRLRPAG
jgi:hypothetical protein